jgi:ABC-2 type transport system ATP-binding protein
MPLHIHSALSVDAVAIRYGATTAVDNASFDLPRGRVLALLGPNGAGKTSLLRVCEGFRRPDDGRVAVLGTDPYTSRNWLMPKVGIMPQQVAVHPTARAGEILRLFASYAARPLPLDLLIDRLSLAPLLTTPCRRLSGGEQQRLALALAIVGRPELVFLDEPTAGMDLQARHTTWTLIEELRADGVAILLTTHLLDEAERLADDVVIVDHGRVIATGSPAQLTANSRPRSHSGPSAWFGVRRRTGRSRFTGPSTVAKRRCGCAGPGTAAVHGLTPARAEVLWVLHRTGPCTQRQLSQLLKCTPRNVTGLVDALERAGFVERTAHPSDRRAIVVRLSEPGRSLIVGWSSDREQGTTQLLAGIADDDLAVFSAVLDRVLVRLRAEYQMR